MFLQIKFRSNLNLRIQTTWTQFWRMSLFIGQNGLPQRALREEMIDLPRRCSSSAQSTSVSGGHSGYYRFYNCTGALVILTTDVGVNLAFNNAKLTFNERHGHNMGMIVNSVQNQSCRQKETRLVAVMMMMTMTHR